MDFSQKRTGLWTILRAQLFRLISIWKQTIVAPLMSTSLYFIIFGAFIGSRVGQMEGFSYMQFIIPGLIMMPAINGAYIHVAFGVYMARFQRTIEDLVVSPLPPIWMLAGYVSSGMIRGFIISSLTLAVSLFFEPLQMHSPLLVVLFMVLTSAVFSLIGFATSLYARSFDDNNIIPTFVLTPLTYLGGVFYSINELPEFWQLVSKFNPVLYMINGFRYGFLGISDVSVTFAAMLLVGFIIFLVLFNIRLINKGVGLKA